MPQLDECRREIVFIMPVGPGAAYHGTVVPPRPLKWSDVQSIEDVVLGRWGFHLDNCVGPVLIKELLPRRLHNGKVIPRLKKRHRRYSAATGWRQRFKDETGFKDGGQRGAFRPENVLHVVCKSSGLDFGLNCKLFVNVKRKLFSVVGGLRFIWKAPRARGLPRIPILVPQPYFGSNPSLSALFCLLGRRVQLQHSGLDLTIGHADCPFAHALCRPEPLYSSGSVKPPFRNPLLQLEVARLRSSTPSRPAI